MRTYPQIKENLIMENGVRYDKIVSINNGSAVQFKNFNQATETRSDKTFVESMPDTMEVFGIMMVRRDAVLNAETDEFSNNASLHISAECGRLGKWLDDFHFASNLNSVDASNNGYIAGASPFEPGNELFNPYKGIGATFFPGAAHRVAFDISAKAQSEWVGQKVIHETAPFVCGRQGIILEEKEQVTFTFSAIKWPNANVKADTFPRFYVYLYGKVLK